MKQTIKIAALLVALMLANVGFTAEGTEPDSEKSDSVVEENTAYSEYLSELAENIRQTQEILKDCGFNPGPIDGVWGKQTRKATKDFIRASGINALILTMTIPTN